MILLCLPSGFDPTLLVTSEKQLQKQQGQK